MRIADILQPIRVLSWNEKSQQFQLSKTGGAYPKQRASLYRISTRYGDILSTGHHRIFSSQGIYEPVADLKHRDGVYQVCPIHLATILEQCLKSFREDDQHSNQIISGLMGRYADAARLYGQQFQTESESALYSAQQSSDAQELFHSFDHDEHAHKDDLKEPKQSHNRLYQSGGQTQKIGCVARTLALVSSVVNRGASLLAERILQTPQVTLKSRLMFLSRRTKGLLKTLCLSVSQCSSSSCYALSKEQIITCADSGVESIYYDMQVLETNNYVCESGFIHHNSGKSEALIIRLVSLMEEDPGVSVGHYFPSYKLAKRRGLSGVKSYLDKLGYKYDVNKADLTITISELNNAVYYLDTYHDPDSIVSYEIAHAGVDELDTLKQEKAEYVWAKITERTREKTTHECGNTIAVASTTDQGTSGFCFARWGSGEHIDQGYHYIKAGTGSNKFLPEGYVEQIRKNYDPVMAEAFIDGGWVSFTRNKVYHFFNREKHHTNRIITDSDLLLHIGLDFNIGGCCAVVHLIENNNPVAVDEFTSYDTRDFVNNLVRYAGKKCIIYPDASGGSSKTNSSESDLSIIRNAGYQICCKLANPAIRDRVNAFNGLLSHDRYLVNTDKCPQLTNALESQGYDKNAEPEKFTTHPAIDDWCFSGETEIIVNDKRIEFKNIPSEGLIRDELGRNVLFYNGGLKGYKEIFHIALNDGRILHATKEHEFLTLNGWIKAEYLAGEILCNTEYCQIKYKSLMAKSIIKGQMAIFIKLLEVMKLLKKGLLESQYIEQFGVILMDQLKKVVLFIIRTKTKATMIFQTLLLWIKESITSYILLSGIEKILTIQEKTLRNLKLNARNGTDRMPVKSGIKSIITRLKKLFIKKLPENVSNAEFNMKLKTMEKTNIAQKNVKHKREEIAASIMKKGFVVSVAMFFLRINTQQKNIVVMSVDWSVIKEPVYCLSTNNGFFSLASGEIVSNCDSAGYFVAFKYPIIIDRKPVKKRDNQPVNQSQTAWMGS